MRARLLSHFSFVIATDNMPAKQLILSLLLIFVTLQFTLVVGYRRRKLFKNNLENNDLALNETKSAGRRGKLFSMFNVITFTNGPCASTSTVNGVGRNGTCYTATECNDKSGSARGNCAAGFGVCCVFTIDGTNGRTTVNNNCTYIQNEGNPNAITGASNTAFTVNKLCNDVCYIRIDFEMFTLLGTGGSNLGNEGDCIDMFTVTTPTGMQVPTICGENQGQHIYVDIGADSGDIATVTIMTTNAAFNRVWDIKVTQVECSNPNSPRDSCCLQYHTGCTGRLQSFNYGNTNDNHLNSQQYQICIRQECGFCCVEYRICEDQTFTIPTNRPAGWSFDSRNSAMTSKNDGGCVSGGQKNSIDHIGIQASGAVCSPAGGECDRAVNSRYCGRFLNQVAELMANSPICDCTAPFSVDVFFNNVSDEASARGTANININQSRGFCLDYAQVPC